MLNALGAISTVGKIFGGFSSGGVEREQSAFETASEEKKVTGENLVNANNSLSQAIDFLSGAIQAVDVAKEALESVLDMISDLIGGLFGGGDDDGEAEKAEAEQNLKDAEATQAEAEQAKDKAVEDKDNAQAADDSAKQDKDNAKTDLDKAKAEKEREYKEQLNELTKKLDGLQEGTQEYAVTANQIKGLYLELENLSKIGITTEGEVPSAQEEDELRPAGQMLNTDT